MNAFYSEKNCLLKNLLLFQGTQPDHVLVETSSCCFPRELVGAFHYGKPTGQRPVGIPEENGTTYSEQTGPRGMAPTIFISFLNSLYGE